jgi:phosphatidylserine/phosphatidylglycerophosphate/cardiolipin synthase-like enzyme
VHRDASGSKKALEALRTEKALDVHCQLDDHTAAILANAFLAPGSADWLPYSDEIPAYIKKKGNLTAVGAHHHKLLLVYGREGLVGFCGGIDVDENRVRWLHDVHLRATGHAAKELFRIAEQRWAHSKDNGQSPTPTSLNVPAPVMPTADPTPYLARVAQTVGNPDLRYPRVPNTLWDAVQSAVKRASRFIYIEDQYFMSVDLVRALVEASTRVAHITILVPAANVTEPAVRMHRQWAVRKLLELGGPGIEKKIGLYESTHPTHDFIHAKLFIFDDEYAIVGSANANNRGYFTDSEADVCVAEREWKAAAGARQGSWWKMEANFARRLRVSLWHEHLGLEPDELLDGVGARAHWELPPPAATVRPYHVDNLRKQRKRKQYEEWERARAEAVQNGRPFTTKEPELEESFKIWDDTRDRSPWSLAPYEEWEPERVVEDAFVDPVQ